MLYWGMRDVEAYLAAMRPQLEASGIEISRILEFERRWREGREIPARRILTKKSICAARRKRDGLPCLAKGSGGGGRCKLHGGMSTGARTAEGRARIAEAQRRRWARHRAQEGRAQ